MTPQRDVTDLDLSDAELVELLTNHGLDRRTLMRVLGVGSGITVLGGTAAASNGRDARIDDVFGASYSTDETPPPGLIDHEVELRVIENPNFRDPNASPDLGTHSGFPLVDSQEDGDFMPDAEQGEFFFDPVGLHVESGDVVHFSVVEDHVHTVSAFDPHYEGLPRRMPAGASFFTSPPVGGDESWLYRFDTTGVYDIACLPHFPIGMVMRVVVGDGGTDWGALPNPPGPTNPFRNAELVLTDSALDPSNIVSAGEVPWSNLSL